MSTYRRSEQGSGGSRSATQGTYPLTISDKDAKNHYLEHTWKRLEVYHKECMNEWRKRPNINKMLAHAITFFKGKQKEHEEFIAAGGVKNTYTTANLAIDITESLKMYMDELKTKKEEALQQQQAAHALAVSELQKSQRNKIEVLKEEIRKLTRNMKEN